MYREFIISFSLCSGNRITSRQLIEVPTPTIVKKLVAEMYLAVKRKQGLIVENCTGATVNNILPDEKSNERFNKTNRNIIGVDWGAEPQKRKHNIRRSICHIQTTIIMRKWRVMRAMTKKRTIK